MMGAVLGRPLLPFNGARANTEDVSSRRAALRNRLSITDLQPAQDAADFAPRC